MRIQIRWSVWLEVWSRGSKGDRANFTDNRGHIKCNNIPGSYYDSQKENFKKNLKNVKKISQKKNGTKITK